MNHEIFKPVIKRATGCLAMLGCFFFVSTATAAITVYTDEPTFDAAFPNLALEDFEAGNITGANVTSCPGPFDSTTDNACFTPGDIVPGVLFRIEPVSAHHIALLGPGFSGNPTKVITANVFVDSFVIEFSVPVNVVGFLLQSHHANSTCDITVNLLGGAVAAFSAPCSNAGTFRGLRTNALITSIVIDSQTDQSEGVDNIRFGVGCGAPLMGCTAMDKAGFKANLTPGKESFSLKMNGNVPEQGNPVTTDGQHVCVFDKDDNRIVSLYAAAGGTDSKGKPNWKADDAKGSYKDKDGVNPTGMAKHGYKEGKGVKSKAKGSNLSFLNPFVFPVTLQQSSDNGNCTEAVIPAGTEKNGKVQGKTP